MAQDEHSATVLPDGRVLVAGGLAGPPHRVFASGEIFDPEQEAWSTAGGAMGDARFAHTATLLPGTPPAVVVAGGLEGTSEQLHLLGSAELYLPSLATAPPPPTVTDLDPPTESPGALIPKPSGDSRFLRFLTLLADGRVLAGGDGAGADSAVYDPARNVWVPTAASVGPNFNRGILLTAPRCALANPPSWCNKVLITSDATTVSSASSLLYDPATGTSRGCSADQANRDCPGPLVKSRLGYSATVLADAKVLVAGGVSEPSYAPDPTAEVFDPDTGKWTLLSGPGSSLHAPRTDHLATRLGGGKVLVVGGRTALNGDKTTHLDVAELYDPVTQRWSLAGTTRPRVNSVIASLASGPRSACGPNCGKVLVAGGDGTGGQFSTVDLYTPRPGITAGPLGAGPLGGGTPVTIVGTGLTTVTAVTFDGVPARSITTDEASPDTKLVAVSPLHPAGLATVQVFTKGGSARAGTFLYERRLPDAIKLAARPLSASEIELSFPAPSAGFDETVAATAYIVKQSLSPITSEARSTLPRRCVEAECATTNCRPRRQRWETP